MPLRPSRHGEQPRGGPPNSARRPFLLRSCNRMNASAGSRPGSKRSFSLSSGSTGLGVVLGMRAVLAAEACGAKAVVTTGIRPGSVMSCFFFSEAFRTRSASLSSSSSESCPRAKAPFSFSCLFFFNTSILARSSSALRFSSSAFKRRSSALASYSSRALCSSLSFSKRNSSCRCLSSFSSRFERSPSISSLSGGLSLTLPFLSGLICSARTSSGFPGFPAGGAGLFLPEGTDSQDSAARATAAYHPSPRSLAWRRTTPVSGASVAAALLARLSGGSIWGTPTLLPRLPPFTRRRLLLREREREVRSFLAASICFCASSTSARQGVSGGGALL
mmetsp:Transcript_75735/g.225792  ORF Transcript_75735/g.225792 Transcript_75735/m.225792 type:complete len:333 (+) Transcript_75735:176-1174(+)